jgi:hypothetical protein
VATLENAKQCQNIVNELLMALEVIQSQKQRWRGFLQTLRPAWNHDKTVKTQQRLDVVRDELTIEPWPAEENLVHLAQNAGDKLREPAIATPLVAGKKRTVDHGRRVSRVD